MISMKHLVFVTTLALVPGAAFAQAAPAKPVPSEAQLKEAKTYYQAGSTAYEAGDFDGAIQAFLEANKRAERPAVTFAIAQAFRRKYYIDKSVDSLQQALAHYRGYLQADPRGARAADASQALAELGPAEERLLADPNRATTRTEVSSDKKTRVALSSPAVNAQISIDGGPFAPAPLLREVTPGKHLVRVRGEGYEDEQRDIVAVEGSLVAFDVNLKDKPATFVVEGEQNARIEIDGRLATDNLSRVYTLAPGKHLIAVSRTGHDPYVRELTFTRGEKKKLKVELRTTSRRRISNGFLIAGGVGAIGAGVLGLIALERDGAATDIRDARGTRNITADELESYDSARTARNNFALAAGLTGGAAVILGGLGLALHIFDDPPRNAPQLESDSQPTAAPDRTKSVELGLAPWATPNGGGAGLHGRF